MKKRVLSMLLATAMVATLATGCSSSDSGSTSTSTTTTTTTTESTEAATESEGGGQHFEIVSKGFQHQYWVAVKNGAEARAAELGVTINFVGPNTESDIADQVQMLNNAINASPNGIGFAALDTNAALDAMQSAVDSGIPIVGFDSGVPNAPEGAVLANVSTDNYAAGELAAEESYKMLQDVIASASEQVKIGVLAQDATSESVINRGLGFIDKIAELCIADGKTVMVVGNDRYVSDASVVTTDGADVVIDVTVPASIDMALAVTGVENMLNQSNIICIYGSNQFAGEAMVQANELFNKLGTGEGQVIGVAFDSGANIKAAVESGILYGAITQAPVAMGELLVQALFDASNGATLSDIDTGCQFYTADNMNDSEIAQNLYD